MKLLILVLFAVFAVNSFGADTNLLRELEELTRDRDRAASISQKAIDRMYQSSLKRLLDRATQAEDKVTAEKIKQVLERLSPTAPKVEITEAQRTVTGTWKFANHTDGHTAVVALNDDFTYTVDGHRIGSWRSTDEHLFVTLDRGGHADRYVLPVREGMLHGVNGLGHALTLTLVETKGQEAKIGDIFGTWKFTNHTDGHTAVVEVNQDLTYSEGGNPIGTWLISNRQLVISYDESEQIDRYNLPPLDRQLNGVNNDGHALTLQRKAE